MPVNFTSTSGTPSTSSGGNSLISSLLGLLGGGNVAPPGFSNLSQALMAQWQQNGTGPFASTSSSGSGNGIDLTSILKGLGLSIPSLPNVKGTPGINPTGTIPVNGAPGSNGNGASTNLSSLLPILALLGISGGLNNRATTQTSTPNLPGNLQPLQQSVIDGYTKSILGTDLTGYTASGVDDINKNADLQRQNATETAAAHGVQGPAVDTSLNNIDANRFSAVNKFRQSIPLLQQSIQQQALSNAGGFVNQSKTGLTTTNSGNVAGGALSGPASLLAYLYGTGQF